MWIKFVLFTVFLAVFTAAIYQLLLHISKKKKEEKELEKITDEELVEGAKKLSEKFEKSSEK